MQEQVASQSLFGESERPQPIDIPGRNSGGPFADFFRVHADRKCSRHPIGFPLNSMALASGLGSANRRECRKTLLKENGRRAWGSPSPQRPESRIAVESPVRSRSRAILVTLSACGVTEEVETLTVSRSVGARCQSLLQCCRTKSH